MGRPAGSIPHHRKDDPLAPTVVDPPFGSVENLAAMIRRFPGDRKAYLLGLIDSIISDLYGSDTRKVGFIRNALVAGHLVDKEPVDPTGQLYSREADDPTPVSGARVEPHVGGMTEGGLVDETEELTGAAITESCVITGWGGLCPTHQARHIASGEAECGCPVYPFAGRGDAADTIVDHRRDCPGHPYAADA